MAEDQEAAKPMPKLLRPRSCYICKENYNEVHHFYDRMCPECAKFNFTKRFQSCDLSGKIALVTGARIKIGYEICLKLLRSGCQRVIATTRFPRDAALRFSQEPDFETFKDRLDIYGLDLLYVPTVERFCAFLRSKYSHLDILINNAAMTLSRSVKFFEHLQGIESAPLETLSAPVVELMSRTEPQFSSRITDSLAAASLLTGSSTSSSSSSISSISLASQSSNELVESKFFDGDGQVIDLAPVNSWKQEIEDVPTADLAQVMLINAIAPFVLVSKLKPMLEKSPHQARFIINVSAMEGQFSRLNKTSRHPHTNCAKASLNMMTRTIAQHYAQSGICTCLEERRIVSLITFLIYFFSLKRCELLGYRMVL
jgi:NAD(P)-dependent dehydrogenase (short-subunit alcohol dehydrogenase family)